VRDNLPQLKRRMKRHGITQHRVAAVAGVDRTMVNKVINGRAKSQRVIETIVVLIATQRELAHAS
jgi:transcriptional regulator with XRE-family HTH domain